MTPRLSTKLRDNSTQSGERNVGIFAAAAVHSLGKPEGRQDQCCTEPSTLRSTANRSFGAVVRSGRTPPPPPVKAEHARREKRGRLSRRTVRALAAADCLENAWRFCSFCQQAPALQAPVMVARQVEGERRRDEGKMTSQASSDGGTVFKRRQCRYGKPMRLFIGRSGAEGSYTESLRRPKRSRRKTEDLTK